MTDRELMQQALSTLEGWANHGNWVWPESALEQCKRNTEETIIALRERLAREERLCTCHPDDNPPIPCAKQYALAQCREEARKEQEPVAWGMPSAGGSFIVDCITPEEHDREKGGYTVPLYTAPQPAVREVVHVEKDGTETWRNVPAVREWVGLTDGVMCDIAIEHGFMSLDWIDFARAIEAKLKEKNA